MEEISCKELLDGNEALILNHSGLLSKGATLVLLFNPHLHDILCRLPIVFVLRMWPPVVRFLAAVAPNPRWTSKRFCGLSGDLCSILR